MHYSTGFPCESRPCRADRYHEQNLVLYSPCVTVVLGQVNEIPKDKIRHLLPSSVSGDMFVSSVISEDRS